MCLFAKGSYRNFLKDKIYDFGNSFEPCFLQTHNLTKAL